MFVQLEAARMVMRDTWTPRVRGSWEPAMTCSGTQPATRNSSRTRSPAQAGRRAVSTLPACSVAIFLPSWYRPALGVTAWSGTLTSSVMVYGSPGATGRSNRESGSDQRNGALPVSWLRTLGGSGRRLAGQS